MKKILLLNHNEELLEAYKSYRNFLNKLIAKCKNDYYTNEVKKK